MVQPFPSSNPFVDVLVLVRRHGARSPENAALSSDHCLNCGAPEEPDDSEACKYCGTRRGLAGDQWLLEDVTRRGDARHREATLQPVTDSWMEAVPEALRRPSGTADRVAVMLEVIVRAPSATPAQTALVESIAFRTFDDGTPPAPISPNRLCAIQKAVAGGWRHVARAASTREVVSDACQIALLAHDGGDAAWPILAEISERHGIPTVETRREFTNLRRLQHQKKMAEKRGRK